MLQDKHQKLVAVFPFAPDDSGTVTFGRSEISIDRFENPFRRPPHRFPFQPVTTFFQGHVPPNGERGMFPPMRIDHGRINPRRPASVGHQAILLQLLEKYRDPSGFLEPWLRFLNRCDFLLFSGPQSMAARRNFGLRHGRPLSKDGPPDPVVPEK